MRPSSSPWRRDTARHTGGDAGGDSDAGHGSVADPGRHGVGRSDQGLRALARAVLRARRSSWRPSWLAPGLHAVPAGLRPAMGPSTLPSTWPPPPLRRPDAMHTETLGAGGRAKRRPHLGASHSGATATEHAAQPGTADHTGATTPADTWALVERAQAGDGEAFATLYDLYVTPVYRFVYYRVHDRALAEDLTSETFLRALRRIDSVQNQGRDIGAWFMTIARNLIYDHSKSARNRLEVCTADTGETEHADPDNPETIVLAGITEQALLSAINQLSVEQRECVVLRFLEGYSVAETAAVMGKREGAVKAMQHRAVRRLAVLLDEEAAR